jgi:release factor glutamine methyltransferase
VLFSTNHITDIKKSAIAFLTDLYPLREAENMVNLLIEFYLGLSRVEQQFQKERRLSESELQNIHQALQRLHDAEPIQYVLGATQFCGLHIAVGPEVLIPRPETEELVEKILQENEGNQTAVLDVGTGSGCIALALKNAWRQSLVTAIDVSAQSLELARRNARHNKLEVNFKRCDILEWSSCRFLFETQFQLLVSNPPYVMQKEKENMRPNVLQHEPPLALFVPDNDPLIFYRRIKELADRTLAPGGKIYLEINEQLARETAALFPFAMYEKPAIMKDIHGKNRFLRVVKRLF